MIKQSKQKFWAHSRIYIIIFVTLVVASVFVAGYYYFQKQIEQSNIQTQKSLVEARRVYDSIPIWHKKIKVVQDLKIGIITDTHVHATRIDKSSKYEGAPRHLRQKDRGVIDEFIKQMSVFDPNMIVHLGDVIEGTDESTETGKSGLVLTQQILSQAKVPIYWIVGNHDLRSVTKEEFQETLGMKSLTQTFDVGDYRFVILDANFDQANVSRTPTDGRYIRGHLPPQQLSWLKEQLATDKQTFVFMHQGAFTSDSKGDYNEQKQKNKMKQSIDNADELQEIFDEYRVAGFFNGHMEAKRYKKDKWTAYNSFTGAIKSADYPNSYYELTITDGVPDVTMYYKPGEDGEIKKVDFESGEK